jgi:hypothetical protein
LPDVTPEAVRVLADAAGLPLIGDDVLEVTYRLNAFLAALAPLRDLALEEVPPLPAEPGAP